MSPVELLQDVQGLRDLVHQKPSFGLAEETFCLDHMEQRPSDDLEVDPGLLDGRAVFLPWILDDFLGVDETEGLPGDLCIVPQEILVLIFGVEEDLLADEGVASFGPTDQQFVNAEEMVLFGRIRCILLLDLR